MMWIVLVVEKTRPIEIQGLETDLELSWAEGMRGCIPVFDTYEEAVKYRDKIDGTAGITEVEIESNE